jgi:hypothetical protein
MNQISRRRLMMMLGVVSTTFSSTFCKTPHPTAQTAPTLPVLPSHDAATIQAKLDALPTSGGTIFLEPGTYDLSRVVNLPAHLHLIGSGSDRTTLVCTNGRLEAAGKSQILIEGINFDLKTTENFKFGVKFSDCQQVTVRRCAFFSSVPYEHNYTNMGIAALRCHGVTVEDCTSDGMQFKLAGPGGGSAIAVRNCSFVRPHQYAVSVVLADPDDVIDGVLIENCTVDGTSQSGSFYIGHDRRQVPLRSQTNNVIIRNCTIHSTPDDGYWRALNLMVAEQSHNWVIEQITIDGAEPFPLGILFTARDGVGSLAKVIVRRVNVSNASTGGVEFRCKTTDFQILDCEFTGGGISLRPGTDRDITTGLIRGNRVTDADAFLRVDTRWATVRDVEVTQNTANNVVHLIQQVGEFESALVVHNNRFTAAVGDR